MKLYKSFDQDLINFIEEYAIGSIVNFGENNINSIDSKHEIIKFELPASKTEECLFKLQSFGKEKYMFFYTNKTYDDSTESICVINSTDKFDILRAVETNGINYDKQNEDIIKKLKEWDCEYGIKILGADYDWVDIEFDYINKDLTEFAHEVYNFCPDCVNQGLGSIDMLIESLDICYRVFLWWD